MASSRSDGSKAMVAFAQGGPPGEEAVLRKGASDLVAENRRLRAILTAMARQELGHGVLVDLVRTPEGQQLVVCCGSIDEARVLDVVGAVLGNLFDPSAATRTGVTAAEAEVTPRERAKRAADRAEEARVATRRLLRRVVQEEVRALPDLGTATTFEEAHERLMDLLGTSDQATHWQARWDIPEGTVGTTGVLPAGSVSLMIRGALLEVGFSTGRSFVGYALTGSGADSFDAALRTGFDWLAERDVFVTVRS